MSENKEKKQENNETNKETVDSAEMKEPTHRPGYSYSINLFKQSGKTVRVKLEIDGQTRVVPVCALCHKINRICCLDPSLTAEQIASAKYLGVEDQEKSEESKSSDAKDANSMAPEKSSKEEDEKKKKKKSDDSDSASRRRRTQPNTSWTTNTPSHEEWNKKKKKDF